MKPLKLDFLKWINENGELDEKAPDEVKKEFGEWKKHYDEWKKERSKEK